MSKTTKAHSIHCAGYRGRSQPWDESKCNCGAMPREIDPLKLLDEAQAAQRRLEHELSEAIKDRDDMALFQRVVQRRDRQIELLAAQANEARNEINTLRGLLKELVDGEPCRYDHHGYCQSHWLHERPCPHERAKAMMVPQTTEAN